MASPSAAARGRGHPFAASLRRGRLYGPRRRRATSLRRPARPAMPAGTPPRRPCQPRFPPEPQVGHNGGQANRAAIGVHAATAALDARSRRTSVMLIIPGAAGRDLCDPPSRRSRGASSCASAARRCSASRWPTCSASSEPRRRPPPAAAPHAPRGFGAAKSVIMVYLQGGPSHLDLWDPKEDVPDNVRSVFKPISTKLPGVQFTELLPKLAAGDRPHHAHPLDQLRARRPVQPHGRHLPDDDRLHDRQGEPVGPARAAQRRRTSPTSARRSSGSSRRPSRCCRSSCCRGRCRRATSSARAARPGSSARRSTRTRCTPTATTWTSTRWSASASTTSSCGPRFPPRGSRAGRGCATRSAHGMPGLEQAVADYKLDENYQRALDLIVSGRAREAFDLSAGARRPPRAVRQERLRPELPARPAADRSRHARRRGAVAQRRQRRRTTRSTRTPISASGCATMAAPMLDAGLSTLVADLDQRGLLEDTLVVAVGEFGRSPQRGLSTWATPTATTAATTGRTASPA